MSQPFEKKNKLRQTLSGARGQVEDEEYDVYLLWPSRSRRDASGLGDTPSSPLYGPVSIDSESTEYDYSEFSSGPPSPITFAEFPSRVSTELDFGAGPSDSPEGGVEEEGGAEAEPPKEHITSEPAKYSPIFKLGFFLSQMTHVINRAIEGVKIKTGKPRSQTP